MTELLVTTQVYLGCRTGYPDEPVTRPTCGSASGYALHYRHNERACEPCLAYSRVYLRAWRAARKGKSR
jgi:hypothetical protein